MYRVRLPIADMKQGIKNGRYGYPKSKENNMKPREIKLYWKEQKDTAPTIEPNTEFDTDIKKMAKDQRSRRTEVYTVLGGTK